MKEIDQWRGIPREMVVPSISRCPKNLLRQGSMRLGRLIEIFVYSVQNCRQQFVSIVLPIIAESPMSATNL
jgi:hypothetical protein